MLHVVYQDASVLVINKASGVLSQPGKTQDGSVVTQVREIFSDARGPLLVHRLDMDTSGLIMVAKTRNAHRNLQQQFENRQVKKRYTALLGRKPNAHGGIIDLPLSKDWINRPKQCVDFETGKRSVTVWRLAENCARRQDVNTTTLSAHNHYRVYLYPQTGRTHQLRVHMAEALQNPIVGDRLYGVPSLRLMLHADRLSFLHPENGERLSISCPASF